MTVDHDDPDCTRFWVSRQIGPTGYWLCEECGAVCPDLPENCEAALAENEAAFQLARLTAEGRVLLRES